MNDLKILESVLNVYRECRVHSFPVDCFALLKHYHYRIYTYKELRSKKKELYEMCMSYSDEAFLDGNSRIIAYNQDKHLHRIRFSLMHELGHVILGHTGTSSQNEREANAFSSNLLAPRMAIHYARCCSAGDISRIFQISYEASEYALNDYRRWYYRVSNYHMSLIDKRMYAHFYQEDPGQFVWTIKSCNSCGKILYNNQECGCRLQPSYHIPPFQRKENPFDAADTLRYQAAFNHWLYGE